jgi:hypothetical protein
VTPYVVIHGNYDNISFEPDLTLFVTFYCHTTGNAGSGAVATTLGLSYALVRECAMTVWERTYPDEEGQLVPRWKLNKTTKALKFSHKWVVGLLKRVQQSRDGGESLPGCCYCVTFQ